MRSPSQFRKLRQRKKVVTKFLKNVAFVGAPWPNSWFDELFPCSDARPLALPDTLRAVHTRDASPFDRRAGQAPPDPHIASGHLMAYLILQCHHERTSNLPYPGFPCSLNPSVILLVKSHLVIDRSLCLLFFRHDRSPQLSPLVAQLLPLVDRFILNHAFFRFFFASEARPACSTGAPKHGKREHMDG